MKNLKDKIIKWLGGYTKKEYLRSERKYQALLDSKSNNTTVEICNYHIYRTLRIIDNYAKELYGMIPDIWASKMYHSIHNNMYRILVRYVNCNSSIIYTFDTTLDQPKEFINILKENNVKAELEVKELYDSIT